MIYQNSAATFLKATHRGVESISGSDPSEIGICFTPFPLSSIKPETSTFPGDNIPRCSSCSAFMNKFNKIGRNQFQCALCGEITSTQISIDMNNAEVKNEVYEAVVHRKYIIRKILAITDFYIISLSLVKSNPLILNAIFNSFNSKYHPKQVGLAFLHGAISVVKFRDTLSIQTFPDSSPDVKISQLFVNDTVFVNSLNRLFPQLMDLKYIENPQLSRNMIDFGFYISTKFGSNLRLFLDESDFHAVETLNSVKTEALKMCQLRTQASVVLFSNSHYIYKNPLVELAALTGGFFKAYPVSNNNNDNNTIPSYLEELVSLLKQNLYHDTFLFVRPPDYGDIIDYSGQGMLTTNTAVLLTKVHEGESFYFTINAKNYKHPFLQFVIYFTTETNERRFRVFTLPMMEIPIINTELIKNYVAAMVAQRILIEDIPTAKKYLISAKKKFPNFDDSFFNKANELVNDSYSGNIYMKCVNSRSGFETSKNETIPSNSPKQDNVPEYYTV